MNNSLKSDKLLSQYLLKVVHPGMLRQCNLKIRRQDVKNGFECSSIAARQKQSPLYLHTLGHESAVLNVYQKCYVLSFLFIESE